MEIKPPSTDLYTAISRAVSTTPQNSLANSVPSDWKVSQLIQAIITKITDKQLFLDIQGVKANTQRPAALDLHVGDTLKLQIEQLKPIPQFKIVRFQAAANAVTTNLTAKNIVAEKSPITPLLKSLSYVANRPALRPSPLSAEANVVVRDLFKQLPFVFNLKTASQVKNHIENSGLYVESKIKNEIVSSIQHMQKNKISSDKVSVNIKPLIETDLRVQLHRLADLIRTQLTTTKNTPGQPNPVSDKNIQTQQPNRPPAVPAAQASLQNITQREEAMQTFLRQIESSLTHMQQTQLNTLNESQAQAGRPLWLMELPIKNGQDIDLFELRISQDESAQQKDKAKKIWNVTLKFDLNGLGKIKAHITMQNDLISAQFYSEEAKILSLFRENFELLRAKLKCNGLTVGKIECAHANLSENNLAKNETSLDTNS